MLSTLLLAAGEADQFTRALTEDLANPSERNRLERRLQLKTLLFGMGETFRTLRARKG
jgi:hypothetical protein